MACARRRRGAEACDSLEGRRERQPCVRRPGVPRGAAPPCGGSCDRPSAAQAVSREPFGHGVERRGRCARGGSSGTCTNGGGGDVAARAARGGVGAVRHVRQSTSRSPPRAPRRAPQAAGLRCDALVAWPRQGTSRGAGDEQGGRGAGADCPPRVRPHLWTLVPPRLRYQANKRACHASLAGCAPLA
jgi:hypothetical protein